MGINENEEITVDGLEEIETTNTPIDEIDSENVDLIFIGIDGSGSMNQWESDMKASLTEFKDGMINSKESDHILIARADFNSDFTVGGYKTIQEFSTNFSAGGSTALFDTIVEGVAKLVEYKNFLYDQGMRVKAVFAIFSDGLDNVSRNDIGAAKAAIERLNTSEEITTAFISFGGEADSMAKDLGFKNILPVTSSASELRKAFNRLSKSVINASKSVVAPKDDFFI